MTGAYLRIKRDGKMDNVEVEHLTDKERKKLLENDPRLLQWLDVVCHKLVETEKFIEGLKADGIIEWGMK